MVKLFVRSLALLWLTALMACTSASAPLTPVQRLYDAHGNYNIALGVAVAYAESSVANPAIVHRLRQANDVAAPAFRYSEAVVACAGAANSQDPVVMAANVRCQGLDLSPAAVQRNSGLLVNAATQIYGLLRNAATRRLIGGN